MPANKVPALLPFFCSASVGSFQSCPSFRYTSCENRPKRTRSCAKTLSETRNGAGPGDFCALAGLLLWESNDRAATHGKIKIDKENGCGTKQCVTAISCFYITINKVPAAMSAPPIRLLAVNGSCRMKNASASVMTTLSLSMGTTLDAAPICRA